jgi:hypothetical protein
MPVQRRTKFRNVLSAMNTFSESTYIKSCILSKIVTELNCVINNSCESGDPLRLRRAPMADIFPYPHNCCYVHIFQISYVSVLPSIIYVTEFNSVVILQCFVLLKSQLVLKWKIPIYFSKLLMFCYSLNEYFNLITFLYVRYFSS